MTKTMIVEGITTLPSEFGAKETMDRLEALVKIKGMVVFARIDHAAGAREIDLALRPTELLIFGNAKAGTPLMQLNQVIGIDLPLKVLVWEDAKGKTLLSYNEPVWLANRHGLGGESEPTIKNMTAALTVLAKSATER